jgi:hypothetical protein
MNFQNLNSNLNHKEIGKEFHLNPSHWAETGFAAQSTQARSTYRYLATQWPEAWPAVAAATHG